LVGRQKLSLDWPCISLWLLYNIPPIGKSE
jgi:hypothetical protein